MERPVEATGKIHGVRFIVYQSLDKSAVGKNRAKAFTRHQPSQTSSASTVESLCKVMRAVQLSNSGREPRGQNL